MSPRRQEHLVCRGRQRFSPEPVLVVIVEAENAQFDPQDFYLRGFSPPLFPEPLSHFRLKTVEVAVTLAIYGHQFRKVSKLRHL